MAVLKKNLSVHLYVIVCLSLYPLSSCHPSQVVLVPEEPEDMWHAYNLVALGDSVKSTTIRKVKDESTTGSSTTNRVRTTLTLSVEGIEFDTSACELRVKGRNIQENQYVKVRGRRERGEGRGEGRREGRGREGGGRNTCQFVS